VAAIGDGRVRRRAVEIYAAAAADWTRAPSVLGRAFRDARELRSPERRFVGEAVYGMIRWRRRLAFAVDAALPSALALYLAWLWQTEAQASPALAAELARAGVDAARLGDVDERLAALPPAARLAIAESVPDWIAELLIVEHGLDGAAAMLAAMNRRAPLSARANRLKNTREELAERLADENVATHPSALAPDGLELETHVNAYGLGAFREGRFELQDAGSQLIAELCAPPPRGRVVDACAGAGGKTLALGALMGNRGRLTALDTDGRKLEELRRRARRAGLTNVQAIEIAAGAPPPAALVGAADRVLVDAPCSGLGVLRRNPEARWRLDPADLEELGALQRALVASSARMVAPGGRLIYATCSVARHENDAVVDEFARAHPEFEEVPVKEILGGERARALLAPQAGRADDSRARAVGDGTRLRLLPHVHDCDGFFAAVLRLRR
jgi:16S rRNA (cytosine967-C5)-methyltransferase